MSRLLGDLVSGVSYSIDMWSGAIDVVVIRQPVRPTTIRFPFPHPQTRGLKTHHLLVCYLFETH